jgi:hypothetical protein
LINNPVLFSKKDLIAPDLSDILMHLEFPFIHYEIITAPLAFLAFVSKTISPVPLPNALPCAPIRQCVGLCHNWLCLATQLWRPFDELLFPARQYRVFDAVLSANLGCAFLFGEFFQLHPGFEFKREFTSLCILGFFPGV